MKCRLITDLDELADHRDRWEALRRDCHGSLCTSYDLSKTWLDTFKDTVGSWIVIAEEGGSLLGVAPFISQDYSIRGLRIRSRSLIGDVRGTLGFTGLRILCQPGRPDVVPSICGALKAERWDALRVSFLEMCDENERFLDGLRSFSIGQPVPEASEMQVKFPETGDIDGNFGKSTRENIRRMLKKLEREDRLQFRSVEGSELDRSIDTYVEQHSARWNDKGGSMFQSPKNVEFFKRSMNEAFRQGFGHAYELIIDGEVAAQCFGFHESGQAFGYRIGMNNAFAKQSPGMLLLYFLFSELRERDIGSISIGYGDEGYKRSIGGTTTPLLGLQTKRGMLSTMSRLAGSYPARRIESMLGLRERVFGGMYR